MTDPGPSTPRERWRGDRSSDTDRPSSASNWVEVLRRLARNRSALAGLVILVVLVVIALSAPAFYHGDYRAARFLPGMESGPQGIGSHYGALGTDSLGRNLWHRASRGIGISLGLGAVVSILTTLLGLIIGGVSGYLGGWFDTVATHLINAMSTVPTLLIGICTITFFGSSFWAVFGTLVGTGWLNTARLSRTSVRSIRSREYIDSARATGASEGRVLVHHVLPNALPPIIVSAAFGVSAAILHESVYSFLGVGFVEPTPSLGVLIRDARNGFRTSPHLLLVPASLLIAATLAVVMVSDGLRDALDPSSARRRR